MAGGNRLFSVELRSQRDRRAANVCNNILRILSVALCLIAVPLRVFAAEPAPSTPVCTDQQLLALAPDHDGSVSHRRFGLPKIAYPFGAQSPSRDNWGFGLTVRIDESGRVVCYSSRDRFDTPLQLNDRRRELLTALSRWSYTPYSRDGTAISVVRTEDIYEEELPREHLIPPRAPLQTVRIGLERSGCYGTCPAYKVELFGDGRVAYEGRGDVDVLGEHDYRVDPDEIATLVESARSKDLWSLRSEYVSGITDNAAYEVTIAIGNEEHRIVDYAGKLVGMPKAVTDFEDEVDEVAQSAAWIHLGQKAVEHLRENHFSFTSREGGEILVRSIADEEVTDDQALLELIKLGAPWSIKARSEHGFRAPPGPALDEALVNQREAVADVLIKRGALLHGGAINQQKLDGAFRAAIRGGRLILVRRVWDAGGTLRPSLTYVDVASDPKPIRRRVPVTLLLSHESYDPGTKPWEGLGITKWLTAKGCDINAHGADGRTLLHIAAQADDLEMVRYVLNNGVPASTPGAYSLPALGSVGDEDVALLLLEAGTDLSMMGAGGAQFRRYAINGHWERVLAWLDAHKGDSP